MVLSQGLHIFSCSQRTTINSSIEHIRWGWHGAPYFRRYGRELVSKPAISPKKCCGGCRRTTSSRHFKKHAKGPKNALSLYRSIRAGVIRLFILFSALVCLVSRRICFCRQGIRIRHQVDLLEVGERGLYWCRLFIRQHYRRRAAQSASKG